MEEHQGQGSNLGVGIRYAESVSQVVPVKFWGWNFCKEGIVVISQST